MRRLYRRRPLCFWVLLFTLLLLFFRQAAGNRGSEQLGEYDVPSLPRENLITTENVLSYAQYYKMRQPQPMVTLSGVLTRKDTKNDRQIYYITDCYLTAESAEFLKKTGQQNIAQCIQRAGVICYLSEGNAKIGMRLMLKGRISRFSAAENEGQFDARDYYRQLGYETRMVGAEIVHEETEFDRLGEALYQLRRSISEFYGAHMTAQNASVLSAMVVGEKSQMDPQIKNLYQKNGIAHILAISGLHITFFGMGLYQLLRKLYLPPFFCGISGMALIYLYGRLVQGQSSVFRASCMFLLFLSAQMLGESYDMLTAMAVSAFFLLLLHPFYVGQAGFWLSYLAVFAIAIIHPILQERMQKARWFVEAPGICKRLAKGLVASLSVQLLTLPVLLWFYYEFPVYSILLNLLVVPCLSIVLISGFAGAMLRMWILLIPAGVILTFYEMVCFFFSKLPHPMIQSGRPKVWQLVGYYGLLFVWLIRLERGRVVRFLHRRVMPLVMMVLLLYPSHRINCVDMLSVGQGDCICLRSASGGAVLVDGGSSSEEQVGQYRLIPYLKYNGIHRIDAIVISHAHADHVSAIIELLESAAEHNIQIGYVVLSELAEGNKMYNSIYEAARKAAVPVRILKKGQSIEGHGIRLACVYPDRDTQPKEENDESMVLLANIGQFCIFLTGDLTQQAEEEVVNELRKMGEMDVDCLKIAHHGSETSNGEILLEAIRPETAIVSCGRGNRYGHPDERTLKRFLDRDIKVYGTPWQGQIRIMIKRKGYELKSVCFD